MAYDNTNRGALFENNKKSSDKHPDYTGKINVNGEEFWLSAWVKESKSGDEYFSLAVSPPQEAKEAARQKTKPAQGKISIKKTADVPFDDDQIPF